MLVLQSGSLDNDYKHGFRVALRTWCASESEAVRIIKTCPDVFVV